MTGRTVQIVTATDVANAMNGWVVEEIKSVGSRYFELAKFFFGVSVGSFAVIPFLGNLGLSISLYGVCSFAPFIFLGVSTLSAIVMAIPISFSINHETDVVREHRDFVKRQRFLTGIWAITWLVGILFLLESLELSSVSVQPAAG